MGVLQGPHQPFADGLGSGFGYRRRSPIDPAGTADVEDDRVERGFGWRLRDRAGSRLLLTEDCGAGRRGVGVGNL
jgi:hypothetical protein